MNRMQRRVFVCSALGGMMSLSFPALGQQKSTRTIGFLHAASPEATRVAAFRRGLSEQGFVEGTTIAIDYRWAEGRFDRLPELATELVRRQVSVIATPGNTAAALAAKAATSKIPIVFGVSEDPVKFGLVASLARPGGNATGVNYFATEIVAKRLSLLRELLPRAVRIAALLNPANATNTRTTLQELTSAAPILGLEIEVFNASNAVEIEVAFSALARKRVDAVFVAPDSFYATRRGQLARLAASHRTPAVYSVRDYVDVGGLMSYGPNITDMFYRVGAYAARILAGRNPEDLPVEQVNKLELVLNLACARDLGLDVPRSLRLRADDIVG